MAAPALAAPERSRILTAAMTIRGAILDIPQDMRFAPSVVTSDFWSQNSDAESAARRNISPGLKNFPRHVLVVDDEPLIRWSVAESLSELGVDVEQAADAEAALRAVTTASLPFDTVVLDLRLPDMDDLSLLGTLRQLLPGTSLILMTAFGTPEIFAEAMAMGATVINKPFELDQLRRLVLAAKPKAS